MSFLRFGMAHIRRGGGSIPVPATFSLPISAGRNSRFVYLETIAILVKSIFLLYSETYGICYRDNFGLFPESVTL